MMQACLSQVIEVLEQQYERYYKTDLTQQLRKESESAQCHGLPRFPPRRQKKKVSRTGHQFEKKTAKKQKKQSLECNKLEIKILWFRVVGYLELEFADLEGSVLEAIMDIIADRILGHQICHVWYDEGTKKWPGIL